jgi:hypothetical protein
MRKISSMRHGDGHWAFAPAIRLDLLFGSLRRQICSAGRTHLGQQVLHDVLALGAASAQALVQDLGLGGGLGLHDGAARRVAAADDLLDVGARRLGVVVLRVDLAEGERRDVVGHRLLPPMPSISMMSLPASVADVLGVLRRERAALAQDGERPGVAPVLHQVVARLVVLAHQRLGQLDVRQREHVAVRLVEHEQEERNPALARPVG